MRALVMSGGGSKIQYHAGAVDYLLLTEGIVYDIYCGVSAGALAASFLAQYGAGEEFEAAESLGDLLYPITDKDVFKSWKPFGMLHGLWEKSFLNSTPLHSLIEEHLSLDRLQSSGKELRVGAVSLTTGKYRVFTQLDDVIVDAVKASSAYPAMLNPIPIDGELWTDGGVRTVTPIKAAIDAGATAIDVIMTVPEESSGKFSGTSAVSIAKRSVDLMNEEIIDSDVKLALLYNKLVACGEAGDKRHIDLRIIRPKEDLGVDSLSFNEKDSGMMQDQGYVDAEEIFASIV